MDKRITCPRCGYVHELRFTPIHNPTPPITHFAICPATGHPILAGPPAPPKPKPRLRE